MKIVHLSTFDTGNGAAIAARRIHQSLLQLGHASTMLVANRRLQDPSVVQLQPRTDPLSRLRRRIRAVQIARDAARYPQARRTELEFFSDDRSRYGDEVCGQIPAADIVNVHAMLDFLDYREFLGAVPRRTPVVRTLHDMSFFTGGCHVAGGCTRFTARCGACPRLGSNVEEDLSRRIWTRKRDAFRHVPPNRLHLVTPSRWLAAEAKRSALAAHLPVTVIPFGVDTDIFRPRAQQPARDLFSVPPSARVVLFVAQPIHRINKGFALLAEALASVPSMPELLLLSAGSGTPPVEPKVPHLHLGHVGDERLLSLAYAAADIVALPSMDDNLPLTALEAIACGRPVVGFAVGGIVDIVRPGLTGLTAPPRDVKSLGTAIAGLLQDDVTREGMRDSCRKVALEEYSLARQAQRYVELYESILETATT
jgi:glycosyltransferase involved in cell wall biosynthesis